ncbi:hypothetical protein BJ170DRAFT_600040 [Xylariales sp. AK1849]|nr:hypothetical protein BJ170DRAFT_600040 [Xylariales sp. AK1849]
MISNTLLAVLLVLSAMVQPSVATTDDSVVILDRRAILEERGIGWLVDYCEDDWNLFPPMYFAGSCNNSAGNREWMHIDLDGCYTVTETGQLSLDNSRHGGMKQACDNCARCTDLDKDACLMCRCHWPDGKHRTWAKADMGGPYCGEKGMPPKPAQPGLTNYNDELPVTISPFTAAPTSSPSWELASGH